MPRSDAKRFSSSLKACPLTKEVMKEVRREEEEQEGMEMAGEFPACERDYYSCKECGNMSMFTKNHKNYMHEDGWQVFCLTQRERESTNYHSLQGMWKDFYIDKTSK